MRAFLINANAKEITAVVLEDGLASIRGLIGFDSVDSDEIDGNGDRLFFDESCFIREQKGAGRFRLDTLPPVSGAGVVVGSRNDGADLADAQVSLEVLQKRVQFL
ncbi:MAG: hypothetical protein RLZZ344_1786 [Pseudomonadota bacterium]|jgi:hypothetical protein